MAMALIPSPPRTTDLRPVRSQQPFRRRELVFELGVYRARVAHGAGPAFEDGFEFVMVGAPVENLGVKIRAGVLDKAAEEVFCQLRLEVADQTRFHAVFVDE